MYTSRCSYTTATNEDENLKDIILRCYLPTYVPIMYLQTSTTRPHTYLLLSIVRLSRLSVSVVANSISNLVDESDVELLYSIILKFICLAFSVLNDEVGDTSQTFFCYLFHLLFRQLNHRRIQHHYLTYISLISKWTKTKCSRQNKETETETERWWYYLWVF